MSLPCPKHTGNLSVDMCHHFMLPTEISCVDLPILAVTKARKCLMASTRHPYPLPKFYNLTTTDANIDFKKVECIAGYIMNDVWKFSGKRSDKSFPVKDVGIAFQQLLPTVKAAIGR